MHAMLINSQGRTLDVLGGRVVGVGVGWLCDIRVPSGVEFHFDVG